VFERKERQGETCNVLGNGTWDIMREKTESETEEPVRSLETSDGT
jgi:hypothetical protein